MVIEVVWSLVEVLMLLALRKGADLFSTSRKNTAGVGTSAGALKPF